MADTTANAWLREHAPHGLVFERETHFDCRCGQSFEVTPAPDPVAWIQQGWIGGYVRHAPWCPRLTPSKDALNQPVACACRLNDFLPESQR